MNNPKTLAIFYRSLASCHCVYVTCGNTDEPHYPFFTPAAPVRV